VCVVTFIGTLLCFAVGLLLAILGVAIVSALRGVHPDMRIAYRLVALPMALVAGSIVFVHNLAVAARRPSITPTVRYDFVSPAKIQQS